jgi:hypothetical protein
MLFLPVITLITLLPISIGGLGARELAMMYMFGSLGIGRDSVVAVSLTVHAMNLVLSLAGGPLFIADQFARRRAAVAATGNLHA